jgi:glycosyltransferase involved in cell wall biosynthesis
MRVALVHDWLTGMRGGERVLERLAVMFPEAPIYTLVWNRGSTSPAIESHPIRTSFLQRLPGAGRHYRWLLPLFPAAIAGFRLDGFDAVVSSSHCAAKSIPVPAGTFHWSYLHTPMRYVWELEAQYFPPGKFSWPISWYVRRTCARLREWDAATAAGPDVMVANSRHVAARIARHYGRHAEVVHPPVALERFVPAAARGEHYLLAGAFAPYKRGELAIEACRRLGRRLIVAGSGQEERRLRAYAGDGIEFAGRVSDEEMARLYASAKALFYPGEEDFGIVPVEAMASGCPVIALGRGGALETVGRGAGDDAIAAVAGGGSAVVPGGVLFGSQTVEGVSEAIARFEGARFDPVVLRAHAEPFSTERFDREVRASFEKGYAAWEAERAASASR